MAQNDGENKKQFEQYVQYQYSYTPITDTAQKKPVCSSVTFVNQGAQTAFIDSQLRILPGQSFTFEGYPGEICIHSFQISFQGTGAKLVIMVCKEYPH